MKKILIVLFVLLILAVSAHAENIYISPLEVKSLSLGADKIDRAEAENIGALYYDKIVRFATAELAYKSLPQLSPASLKILTRRTVTSKLEASVVCFYEKIEYLVFGTISIDSSNNTYYAIISLYSKSQNSILRQISYSEITNSVDMFMDTAAKKMNAELQDFFKTGTALPSGTGDGTDGSGTSSDRSASGIRQAPKIFGLQIGMGYPLMLVHEWSNSVMPRFNAEIAFSFDFPAISNEGFDLDIMLAAVLDYAIALNTGTYANIHFHTTKFRLTSGINFKIGEFMGVMLGGGGFYRADIIDYQGFSSFFFTNIIFAPGAFGMAGIEFYLNKDQTFIMGISNYFDITFYSSMAMENIILMHARFKI